MYWIICFGLDYLLFSCISNLIGCQK